MKERQNNQRAIWDQWVVWGRAMALGIGYVLIILSISEMKLRPPLRVMYQELLYIGLGLLYKFYLDLPQRQTN